MRSPPLAVFSTALVLGCAPVPTVAPVVALPPPAVTPPSATSSAVPAKTPAPPAEDPLQVKAAIPSFHGKVLHPGALRELSSSLADSGPIDSAVDLDGVQDSNRYYRPAVVRTPFVDFKDDDLLGKDGSYTYVFKGVTPGGIYAFETYDSGGGSGIFMNVLLVRITKENERRGDKIEARWVMKRVGSIPLGHRATGEVTLAGGTLTLGPSQYEPKARLVNLE